MRLMAEPNESTLPGSGYAVVSLFQHMSTSNAENTILNLSCNSRTWSVHVFMRTYCRKTGKISTLQKKASIPGKSQPRESSGKFQSNKQMVYSQRATQIRTNTHVCFGFSRTFYGLPRTIKKFLYSVSSAPGQVHLS